MRCTVLGEPSILAMASFWAGVSCLGCSAPSPKEAGARFIFTFKSSAPPFSMTALTAPRPNLSQQAVYSASPPFKNCKNSACFFADLGRDMPKSNGLTSFL